MPPKKTENSSAAEAKKRNIAEATNIVDMLKRSSQQEASSGKKSVKESKIVETAEAGKLDVVANKEPPKKAKKTATETKNNSTGSAKEVVLKQTSRNETVVSSKTATGGPASDLPERSVGISEHVDAIVTVTTSKASNKVDSAQFEGKKSKIDHGTRSSRTGHGTGQSKTGHGQEQSKAGHGTGQSKTGRGTVNSKTGHGTGNSKTGHHTGKLKTGRGHGTGYQYEIDCAAVSDTVDVIHLKRYLETELRVDGERNNLGNTIKVSCEGQQVVIKSDVYLPKKTLRFLSRKFLKKNWNIRVLSKNAHSYEYKYVGHI